MPSHATTANDYVARLTRELVKLPTETEWVEFKENNADPQEIAEYISALSNAVTLCGKSRGYLAWGVDDSTHEIVGTEFDYRKAKKGNEELEAWLARMINPKTSFRFYSDKVNDRIVTLLEVPAAVREPTKFGTAAFIRVGSNKKPLSKFPDREAELWRMLDTTPYEIRLAAEDLPEDDVLSLLDYPGYYRALGFPIPIARDKIITATSSQNLLAPRVEDQSGKFTKATIYSKIPFGLTSKEDRVRTCYMQACLASVTANALTNADVRNLFALEGNAKVKASRVIKDTVDAGLIKPVDSDTAPRYMRYVPFWA